jgi:glycosyltransferase involved in cell wall biosynthesis
VGDGRLHIGVDGRELIGEPTGVGRYLERVLVRWMQMPDWPHRITVFLHGDPPSRLASLAGLEWHIDRSAVASTRWEQIRLPRAVRSRAVDVFFAVGYTAPIRLHCPFVVVVHDVSFATHPEWFGWREGVRRRWLTKWTARRAATVLTVSEFSAEEISRMFGISRDRIRLAPPPARPTVSPWAKSPESLILYVGSMFNRRHVPELIDAFARVLARVPHARLVLVGANRTAPYIDPLALAAAGRLSHAVEWREYVDDAELDDLYRRARVFAFLSEYEGFAMTPMEALAHGVPSVLLDTPVAREIYGDAAVLVPLDQAAIAQAIIRLIDDDESRAGVLEAGRTRLAHFSGDRTAVEIRRALEAAVRSS